ncbi:hypothetical protein POKO110462_17010 [Pontibacter korlensis]|uniref:Uncharacterized protein n=1 Tax=Pontibacter korlensis TaxID=400092 RepID=A0A0E3ZDU3_9BACT|nr:hypothetical protein [Pontibacter korlensis]AKD03320.1 hypothetical protein PKOR_09545 [Pontibacter korlensis]
MKSGSILLLLLLLISLSSLAQSQVKLKEVVVRPELRKEVLGTKQKKADYGHGGSKEYPHYQTAYHIPANGQQGFINRIGVYIYHKRSFPDLFSKPNKLQVYLYAVDSTGQPGAPLLPQPLVFRPKNNTYWHWLDISEYNLQLPAQGVFAAVSWPQATKLDSGPYVGMTNECDTCPFYVYRFMTDDPVWIEVDQSESQGKSRSKEDKFNQNLMVRLEVSIK